MTEINSEQSLSEFGMSALDVEITDVDTLHMNNNADTQITMLSALNVWGCLLRNVAKFCVPLVLH